MDDPHSHDPWSLFGPWLDATRTIYPGLPVWPGDPPVEEEPLSRIDEGAVANVTRFHLGSHTGTHVDPPLHFESGGDPVDALDLDVLCGPCRLVDVTGAAGHITAADLEEIEALQAAGDERLLLRTANVGRAPDRFNEDFTAIAPDAADWLVRRGVRLIGIDGPSIEGFVNEGFMVHHTLLRAGVVVVEGLDLSGLSPGRYEMVCAPLKWRGADGAPARVLLRSIRDEA